MKKAIVLLFCIGLTQFVFKVPCAAQEFNSDEKTLLSIVDHIIAFTSYEFINPVTGEKFKSLSDADYTPEIEIVSPYNTWSYWNGVVNIAMIKLADYFDTPAYREFAEKNYEFAFDNIEVFEKHSDDNIHKWAYPFGQLLTTRELDDCGSMGGGLIEVYRTDSRKDYKAYIDKVADHMLKKQERLSDGTLVRGFPNEMTLWGDDLYMSISFLARMGDLTGERKYFDDAALQVKNFTKYLYNERTQLYSHCWYSDVNQNGVAHWGRCNGWVMLAQAELLEFLPLDHPDRDELIAILYQQIRGAAKYQDESGLWHQLIDKTDSYLETSCTAMFTYAIAKAVNNGWIEPRYAEVAEMGWEGIKTTVQADGQIKGICEGTGISETLSYYYKRETPMNDIHGVGAVMHAGLEVMQMNKEVK